MSLSVKRGDYMNGVEIMPQNRFYQRQIKILQNGSYYNLAEGEKILFGLKKNACQTDYEDYIIYKELTSDNISDDGNGYILTISTDETDIPVGSYYFDVALRRTDGELVTVIGCTEIQIKKSIVLSER